MWDVLNKEFDCLPGIANNDDLTSASSKLVSVRIFKPCVKKDENKGRHPCIHTLTIGLELVIPVNKGCPRLLHAS